MKATADRSKRLLFALYIVIGIILLALVIVNLKKTTNIFLDSLRKPTLPLPSYSADYSDSSCTHHHGIHQNEANCKYGGLSRI